MKFDELIIILKRLYRGYVKKHFKKILIALSLSVLVAINTSGIAWLLDPAVKKIFIDQDVTYAWLIPLGIIVAFAGKGTSLYFARVIMIKIAAKIGGEIQGQIAQNILSTDIQTLDNRHSGKYISNFMFDSGQLTQLVSTAVLNLMKDSFSAIALISLMFYQNWKLALFAMLMIPISGGVAKNLGKRIGKATRQAGEISADVTTFLSEIFKGSRMIRVYQKEKDEEENGRIKINELVNKHIKIGSILIRSAPIMETMTGIMIAGFIFFSGKLIASGEMEVNNFFSFLAAMMLAYQPVRSLATLNMTVYQGAAAAKRIFTVIDHPVEVKKNEDCPDLVIKKSNIEFKNINFGYVNTEKKALKGIDMFIDGGSMTAFVGHSGAGKSTIFNLITRFYNPQNGEILIDNQSFNNIKLSSLRKNISLVSQDVFLFDDTLKNNISYANSSATDNEIITACKYAAADEFIEKLPKKYETLTGENGVRLSGGQKQRISIARAILKNAPIVLLDEATSSLDSESEEIVQDAITNLTKNKTTLVIAHRLSTIHNAKKIFVLKDGKIIESGNHDFLIKNCDEYKSLYEKQLK